MDVLLTFTGFHDPYSKGLIDQEEQPGPILALLTVRSFDSIFLFDTPGTRKITEETKTAILKAHPQTRVQVLESGINDPTNYEEIFAGMTSLMQILRMR
jgi:sigma54-dependent transcription regulator